ncbi:cell division topological specificity factor MinE [Acetohalobium arabaticum]|uniref:Cell division topological specificity factor n=1 Tax=Acetohalobium arabaticum (strain ATCC 49924 / DSM 5501 / Z-7288) TaxID=574087 RepID=D9QV46_ACEAZ|nr:cell division topological specificity factor MinE [Acetohalobium arabaticum]ADL12105.1 cell division topological specificity factor MinE [Acetohalobium arabaticum DSM 5501]
MIESIKNFFTEEKDSKDVAKERLELVLVHDRIDISPETLEDMKGELINVVSKYVKIEESKLEINLAQDDKMIALKANIPVKRKVE